MIQHTVKEQKSRPLCTADKTNSLFYDWEIPDFLNHVPTPLFSSRDLDFRLFRITEISQDKAGAYRMAMANVLPVLHDSNASLLYILSGQPEGVEIYMGAIKNGRGHCAHEPAKLLQSALEGNFPGIQIETLKADHNDKERLKNSIINARRLGCVMGVPSFNEENQGQDAPDFQGIERLINSLNGETWQLIIFAEPGYDSELADIIFQLYDLSTNLSTYVKQSVQLSENKSEQSGETVGSNTSIAHGDSQSESISHNEGSNQSISHSKNQGSSETLGQSSGSSINESHTSGCNESRSSNSSNTSGSSTGKNKNVSENKGSSKTGSSSGTNESRSTSDGTNEGRSQSQTQGTGSSKGTSESRSTSAGTSKGQTESHTTNKSFSESSSSGTNISDGTSTTTGTNTSRTEGQNESRSTNLSTGNSLSVTGERNNKRAEEMLKHINETVIERFRVGRNKGMFRTAMYLSAPDKMTYQRLSQGIRSIFQGNQPKATPLKVYDLTHKFQNFEDLLQLHYYAAPDLIRDKKNTFLAHSISLSQNNEHACSATWLNTRELSLLTGLPGREVPGIKIRKSVDFAVNTPSLPDKAASGIHSLALGKIMQYGRTLHNSVRLPLKDLNKHVFITGVTGAGKTTTCMKLLIESGLPFLVLEPAKTEYRALYAQGIEDVDYYIPGREDISPFRLNPFELVNKKQNLLGHIATLAATLTAVYPMEAAMPQLVEEAIILAYKKMGWDIQSSTNLYDDNPWSQEAQGAFWPTFSDMISELDALIQSKGMGKEFEEKYRGSLVARLSNLTEGIKGRMLNTRRSMNFDALLDRRVVIELEELKNEQDKAIFMGLIITRLAECMKHRHRENPEFRHLTLIEEAHRLLSKPEPGETDARKLGVEMFANLLAEVRKYGEGLIIADQIPNKLIPDVIKNTHTKIVHRLFAADDRNAMGDAMGLSDEQKEFLPMLQTGETIIYCGGWHGPVWVKIQAELDTDKEDLPEEKLRQKGKEQLWMQRHAMLPHTNRSGMIQTREDLSFLMQEGIHTINLFIQLMQYNESKRNDPEWLKALKSGYKRKFEGLQNTFQLEVSKMAELLRTLMWDCLCLPRNLASCSVFPEETKNLLILALEGKDAIKKNSSLRDSRNAFEKLLKTI